MLGDIQAGQVGVSGQAGISGEAGISEETVREVQRTLKDKELYTGQVDSKWGTKTEAALKAFQENNGLAGYRSIGRQDESKTGHVKFCGPEGLPAERVPHRTLGSQLKLESAASEEKR